MDIPIKIGEGERILHFRKSVNPHSGNQHGSFGI